MEKIPEEEVPTPTSIQHPPTPPFRDNLSLPNNSSYVNKYGPGIQHAMEKCVPQMFLSESNDLSFDRSLTLWDKPSPIISGNISLSEWDSSE